MKFSDGDSFNLKESMDALDKAVKRNKKAMTGLGKAFEELGRLSQDEDGNINWDWWTKHEATYHTETGKLEIKKTK